MKKYEAMFIVKPGLSEEEKKGLFNQINETVLKNNGECSSGNIWAERKKFNFTIKKQQEGLFYLLSFSASPLAIKEMRQAYELNENILRVLITSLE